MKNSILLGACFISCSTFANIQLQTLDWRVINDTVMGGRSSSQVVINSNSLLFEGEVSLANNGGFASFRAPYSFENMNAEQLMFKVIGDGKSYQLRLRVDSYLDGPAFVYKFKTEKGLSQVFSITPQDFTLIWRGRTIRSNYQLNFKDVRALGFMISAKQAGKFQLEVQDFALNQTI